MHHNISRRDLFKLAGLSAVSAIALPTHAVSAQQPSSSSATEHTRRGPLPRNIIFMVADGMSAGVLSLADSFAKLARGKDASTHWLQVMQTPGVANGLVETFSLNSMVTDSAAAASAWGSGSRVNNGSLNILPDQRELTTLASLVKQTGRRVGLVTTATITHATPAGFAVCHPKRDEEEIIAEKYLNNVDVLLGGGSRFFSPDTRKDKKNLYEDFKNAGYTLCNTLNDLQAAFLTATPDPSKLLGTFTPSHLPYTVDGLYAPPLWEDVPTLAQMTTFALQSLSQSTQGFFLMVEGAKVDHAAHLNDTAGVLWEQLAFDDAIGEALKFAAGRDDTLIILTTDHANSNPGLNGSGRVNQAFQRIADANASYETIFARMKKEGIETDPDAIRQLLLQHTRIELDTPALETLVAINRKQKTGELNRQHANLRGALGQILGNHTSVGWTGVSHTADYANLTAIGPGAAAFNGHSKNIHAFNHICDLLGIDHRNPQIAPAESWLTQQPLQHDIEQDMATALA